MIAEEVHGAVSVLTPNSPLIAEHAKELGASLEGALKHGLPMVVLDLSSVALMDSAGLEALLDAHDAVRSRGGNIKLAGPTPLVEDILTTTGVGQRFELFANSKSAVGSYSK